MINVLNKISFNIFLLIFVSILIVILQEGEINRDGVLYLNQAHFIVEGSLNKAMSIYNWPFFSFMIAALHNLSGLTFQYSAHLINILLFIIASIFYLKIVSLVTAKKSPLVFATLILLTSIPLMDDYLSMILRDHGLWAGMMIGIYGYLRWINNYNLRWSLLFQAGFLFGTFFRPECLIFNILLPFTHQLFFAKNERLKTFLQSISISLFGLLFLIISVFIFNFKFDSSDLYRLNEFIILPVSFLNKFLEPLDIESQNYLINSLINEFGISLKYLFFGYVVIYKWVGGLGLFHLFLVGYALRLRLIKSLYFRALTVFFIISVLVTVFHFFISHIIVTRYWMMSYWIVYIFASIGLSYCWEVIGKQNNTKQLWVKCFLILIMLCYFLNTLIDKSGEHFEKMAGNWVKSNQFNIDDIYFNQNRIAYYSGFLGYDILDLDTVLEKMSYEYLMIRYDQNFIIKKIPHYNAIEYFPSKEKPKVIVYKRIEK